MSITESASPIYEQHERHLPSAMSSPTGTPSSLGPGYVSVRQLCTSRFEGNGRPLQAYPMPWWPTAALRTCKQLNGAIHSRHVLELATR